MKRQVVDHTGAHAAVEVFDQPKLALYLRKWGEANLGFKYRGRQRSRIYPVGGGVEFDVVLKRKPKSNTFHFPLSGWKDLIFARQRTLSEEWRIGQNCLGRIVGKASAIQVHDANGDLILSRPENIIDSYAIYSRHRNNQYGTGKLAHVLRPKVYDSAGHEMWCQLDYRAGCFTVTVPERALRDFVYPLIVDPTIGTTAIGASTANLSTGFLSGFGTYTPGANGTALTAYIYIYSAAGTENFTLGVYDSTPSTRQAVTAGGVALEGSGWNAQTISASLTSGTPIHIGFADSASLGIAYDTVGGSNKWKFVANTYSSGNLDNPFPGGFSTGDLVISAYLDTAAVAAGTTIVWNMLAVDPLDLSWSATAAAFQPAATGRTTKNTRVSPLGTEIGMGWRMDL